MLSGNESTRRRRGYSARPSCRHNSATVMLPTLHRLHLRLDHVEPKVERELIVPSSLRLDRLHQVLQAAMGWEDDHLHEYIVGTQRSGTRYGPMQDDPLGFGEPALDETAHTLAQIAPRKGDRFVYWYDFGDDWMHTVRVKAVLDRSPVAAPLHCLKAAGACPPEDCGGPLGYARLVEALADPRHEDHHDILEWVGDGFDPAACDIDAINAALAGFAQRWKLVSAGSASRGARGKAARTAAPAARASAAKPARAPSPPLRIDPASALAFIDTYKATLLEIAGPGPDGVAVTQHLAHGRDLLLQDPARIDGAVARLRAAGQAPDEDVLLAMRDIRLQRWIYLRDTRSHSIFMEPGGDTAYGVLGLTQRIRDITGESGMIVETALLAYRGHVISDALIASVARLGPDLRRNCTAALSAAREAGRFSTRTLFPRPPGGQGQDTGDTRSVAPQPANLFDPPAATGGDLVAIATADKAATREQRTFNRLTRQIQRKRRELADWQTWLAGFAERMAKEYDPLRQQMYEAELRLIRRLDALLEPGAGSSLRKPQRAVLQRYLDERIRDLLEAAGPAEDELASLLRKHAGEDIQTLREQERQLEKELAEAMIGDIFGEEMLDGHQADDAESLLRHVQEKLHEREAGHGRADAAAGTGRQHDKRARAADERRAQAEREASQSVREIFRKLASSLHPDRESDPEQRARKTELMQQVTRAYQDNDLLELLTLQVRIEQIDAAHLAGLPDARLKHYNAVLREQVTTLEREIVTLTQPVAEHMQMPTWSPTRGALERELRARIAQLRRWHADVRDETAMLDDGHRQAGLVAELQTRFDVEDAEAETDLAGLDILFGLPPAPAGHGRKPAGSSKKKRKQRR